jgi:tRNA G18 (ribose-2'-O)-methylase SpoU
MERATESLNAAIAASVILFEAARQRRLSRKHAAT